MSPGMPLTIGEGWVNALVALVVWREARGRPEEEIRGILWSMANRVKAKYHGQTGWVEVVTAPAQYSSIPWMNLQGKVIADANGFTWPKPGNPEWPKYEICFNLASNVIRGISTNNIKDATHYFDKSLDGREPAWSRSEGSRHVVDVGDLRFYFAL